MAAPHSLQKLRPFRPASLKNAAKFIYEIRNLTFVRVCHMLYLRHREARVTQKICAELGRIELTHTRLRELLPSQTDTCFIIGSGSTINDLTPKDFAIIRKNSSIGINAWVSHPFTPDAYSFEADGLDEEPSPEIRAMTVALKRKAQDKPDLALLVLRPKTANLAKRMVQIPDSLTSRTLMYGRFNLTTRKTKNLHSDLTRVVAREKKHPLASPVVVDNGATVARLLSVAVAAGFRRVVLVGVDLNTAQYFWDEDVASPRHKELVAHYPRGSRGHHATLDSIGRPFSTLTFLEVLSACLKSEWGVEIMVGSEKSALSSFLPVYEWGA